MYYRPANTLYIPRVADQFDVLTALGAEQRQQRGRIRPEYATAVFVAYIQNKLSKGRTRFEASLKVQDLERGLPHLANSFREARQITGLPPSPLFPPPATNSVPAAPTSQLGLLRTQSAFHTQHPSTGTGPPGMRRASTATTRPAAVVPAAAAPTVRPSDGEGTEPPPPPYSRQDPEPEATAQLARQLSTLTTASSVPPTQTPTRASVPPTPNSTRPAAAMGTAEETDEQRAERERRELEEAIRLSRESAEEEEALRLSRESAEAEEAARREQESQQQTNSALPPPLPSRNRMSVHEESAPGLAAPLEPIRTGSNNPFAAALDGSAMGSQRYAPPEGPPPGHSGLAFVPPSGPPPGHSMNPFADPRPTNVGHEPDLSLLARYDTLILVDDSGSMAGERWRQVRQALMDVVGRVVHAQEGAAGEGKGAEGVEIAFVNSGLEGFNLTTPSSVEKLFNKVKPTNGTPTGAALRRILEPYVTQLEHVSQLKARGEEIPVGEDVRPINVIVLTDGAATDDPESVILDQGGFPLDQVGIQFLQIGNEADAREALQVLDDHIKEKHEVRDIVDTVVYDGRDVSAEQILKVLLGGIRKHLDEQQVGGHGVV